MKIGFDIDGVLADFVSSYQRTVVRITGRDLFHEGDNENPPCWNWPGERGYTKAEIDAVWEFIRGSKSFWYGLGTTEHLTTLYLLLPELEHRHDVYYITSRPGATAKRQTEAWLMRYLPYEQYEVSPTVLIAHKKGAAALALGLDCYIDDNYDNAVDVAVSSLTTRTYLLDRAYNQGSLPRDVARVKTLGEMFDKEITRL